MQRLRITLCLLSAGFWTLVCAPAHGGTPRLLLVSNETSLNARAEVQLDLYLCNDSDRPAIAPAFERISIDYVVRNVAGRGSAVIGSSTQSTSPSSSHQMKPHSCEHRRIKVKIPTQVGDWVEISAEIRNKPRLRSNSIVLVNFASEKE